MEQAKRGRGCPVTGQAKTSAQRQKEYRDRKRAGQVQSLPKVSDLVPEMKKLGRYKLDELIQAVGQFNL